MLNSWEIEALIISLAGSIEASKSKMNEEGFNRMVELLHKLDHMLDLQKVSETGLPIIVH